MALTPPLLEREREMLTRELDDDIRTAIDNAIKGGLNRFEIALEIEMTLDRIGFNGRVVEKSKESR